MLYLYCEPQPVDSKFAETGLIDRVLQPEGCEEVENLISTLPMVDSTSTNSRALMYHTGTRHHWPGVLYGDVQYALSCASARRVTGWRTNRRTQLKEE